MNYMEEIEEIIRKHKPLFMSEGADKSANLCRGCQTPGKALATNYPCDVVKLWTATQALMAERQTRYL